MKQLEVKEIANELLLTANCQRSDPEKEPKEESPRLNEDSLYHDKDEAVKSINKCQSINYNWLIDRNN